MGQMTIVKAARKEHRCSLCHEPIPPGSSYIRVSVTPWDHPDNEVFGELKEHTHCREVWQRIGREFDWEFPQDAGEWADMQETAETRRRWMAELARRGAVG